MKSRPIESVSDAKKQLTLTIIWYVIAAIFGTIGLVFFFRDKNFGNWLICGCFCCVPILGTTLKGAFEQGKKGYRDGANTYTTSVYGNTAYTSNHPYRGAILGFIGGLIGGVLFGAILLLIHVIMNISCITQPVKYLKANKTK